MMRVKSPIPHSSPWITDQDIAAVSATLASGQIAQGSIVKQFETAVGKYLKFSDTWAVCSGQIALLGALAAVGVNQDSKVLLPTYTCRAVKDAIKACGATPVFVDVGEDWCLTPAAVEKAMTPDITAIVVVHPFGIKAAVPPLLQFRVPVIEDCCQCFSPDVGHEGAVAVYSFHATKCLTTGEGGLVATSDPEVASKYTKNVANTLEPSRMSDLQAALGLSQLNRYEDILKRRFSMANRYMDTVGKQYTSRLSKVWNRSMFFRFPLTIAEGYECIAPLFSKHGINTRRGVDALLHREEGNSDARFPVAVELFNTTLSVPLYPAITESQVVRIETAIKQILP